MKILITGSNGLLGQKIVKRCLKHHISFIATSKGVNRNPECPSENYIELDLVNSEEVEALIKAQKPTAIIHTAALTNVDYCELHPEECYFVNVRASNVLFEAAKKVKAHFQLLSTDFVFDGENGPYKEDDTVNPLSIYAQSKVDAEELLLNDSDTNWSIARTIIVYGTGFGLSRSNMILWALEALPKGEVMKLVDDQFRAPTWADDLAYGCVEIIKRNERGIFHLSGPVTRSVKAIVEEVGKALELENIAIETISSTTLNQAAKRPPRTGFDLSKAAQKLDYLPLDIQESIPLLLRDIDYYS
ncbi:SDR family oxidoreductase [Fluviicola taffensis]|uniref:dTDP-4-dehydrorhamnose reductase n=1 Tax=Fluviicola taffensis (strain DSM 16823 / NCIMB 13979 / RW262) TaxID=755732 RepID=F2I9X4_FLUTR|nr:NAD(P)-dependent oxidoreductase [Fluviicola taffensis]AEA44132.1 dTDP-4-dehydrorhamnose reductase [Fluviicola taffensis DSM 16823]